MQRGNLALFVVSDISGRSNFGAAYEEWPGSTELVDKVVTTTEQKQDQNQEDAAAIEAMPGSTSDSTMAASARRLVPPRRG